MASLAADKAAACESCCFIVLVVAVVRVVRLVGVIGIPAARGPATVELFDILQDLLRLVAELAFLGAVESNDLIELGV